MKPAALYARYSSELQRDASIEDQIRLCREKAEAEGLFVEEVYVDRSTSGATLLRPGIQSLLQDAARARFRVVLAEGLDRISRDQEDVAHVYKRLQFAGIDLVTLSEGPINELHIGLKGTMGALFLKDLADKTRRGLRGRVEAGRSGGGNCFGYDVVGNSDEERGTRRINEAEAAVVRRILSDYADGKSPRAIAKALNEEGIASPSNKPWGPSTIHGNRKRGTGILNNELYIGRLVWNRLTYMKNPSTGKRISKENPPEAWIVKDVPELRIVDHDLWESVKARQEQMTVDSGSQNRGCGVERRRPQHLLTGLMTCSVCGGSMVHFNRERIGCANARNRGTCDNKASIKRDKVEGLVLDTLRNHLMDPALAERFAQHYARHANKMAAERNHSRTTDEAELRKVDQEADRLIQAIADGVPGARIKDKMQDLEARRAVLESRLARTPEEPTLVHPSMGTFYRERVADLAEALTDPKHRERAAGILRGLIDKIEFTPVIKHGRKTQAVSLKGKIAGILALSQARQSKTPPSDEDGAELVRDSVTKLVAGIGFEPMTFRL